MSVKFNDHSANERRRNAEVSYKDILSRRLNELNAGADAVQAATLRVFPNLFAAPSVVEAPNQTVAVAAEAPIEQIEFSPTPVSLLADSELSDQEKRLMAARIATEEAHYETAA